MLRTTTLAATLATLTLGGCAAAPEGQGNLLLIVVDDIGPNKMGAYGINPDAPLTPEMDALAESGMRFDNAYANPLCTPGRAALLTGRHGRRYGVGHLLENPDKHQVPQSEWFIPEILAKGAGYASSFVGKWHLSGGKARRPMHHPQDAGFDSYMGSMGNLGKITTEDGAGDFFRWEKVTNGKPEITEHYAVTETIDDAIAQLHTLEEPFVLVVSVNASHGPFHLPPEGLSYRDLDGVQTEVEMYDSVVETADIEVGRLLSAMSIDQHANTTIVLTSDNGTNQHGTEAPYDPDRAKGTPYELGIRVPLIVSGPSVAQPGSSSDQLVHLVDVLPTLADLAGVDPEEIAGPEHRFDGYSLRPVLEDPGATSGREYVFTELFEHEGPGDERVMRDARHKLIRRHGQPDELYDLGDDFLERLDLVAGGEPTEVLEGEHLEAWQRLSDELESWTAEMEAD